VENQEEEEDQVNVEDVHIDHACVKKEELEELEKQEDQEKEVDLVATKKVDFLK